MNEDQPEHYKKLIKKLLGDIDADQLNSFLTTGQKRTLEIGTFLFRQGDRDNSLFIVLSGRCRAIEDKEGVQRILGDIAEGEPVGEFALFTREPRSASVVAIRRSVVLEIDENSYEALVASYPRFANTLTGFIVNRLRRNELQQHQQAVPKNIAIINLQPENDISYWTDAIRHRFAENHTAIHVSDAQHAEDREKHFSDLESREGIHFMVCSEEDMEWSRQCILYSDLVILVSRFDADPGLYPIEKELNLYRNDVLNKHIYLVLLHENKSVIPSGTNHWLHNRNLDLHLHLRRDHPGDIRRFCRVLTRTAVGLVFGGGGAKGFAHVGAVKAILEAGIEIDFVGGTSAGALYGLGMSYADFDIDRILYLSKDSANARLTSGDFNLPIVSIMTGKKMSNYVHRLMGETHLEDFWVTSYCVSTNFSKASTHMHRTGVAWKQIAASIAIPGVFPPVILNRQLHLDGGVVDNLPIEPMYHYPVKHIIAIALTGLTPKKVDLDHMPAARSLFWDKLFRRKKYRLPGLASILINSLTLNSRQRQEQAKSGVSLYVEMDLKGVGMLDDRQWQRIIDMGYEQMHDQITSLPPHQHFWRENPQP
jgi:NTE family protein